jgi:quinol monooxygenase YgiN
VSGAPSPHVPGSSTDGSTGEVELVVVTMVFDAADPGALIAVLSKYVVLTRMEDGCRNVDMVVSDTKPNRILIVEKWASHETQRAHFDGSTMVEMAKSCRGIISSPPDIDMWQSMSAHDLR